jgi:PmbA protein
MRNIIEKTLSMAQDLGIEQCDVILDESDSLNLKAQNSAIETYSVNSARVIGVRVIQGKRVGISYSEDLSDASLKTMVQSALNSSRFAEIDEHQSIMEPKAEIIDRNTKTFQDDTTEIGEKINLALELEGEIRKREPKTTAVPYNGYSEGTMKRHYGNHLGLYAFERERIFSCYTSALLKDGEKQSIYYEGMSSRKFSDLNQNQIMKNTIYHANVLLNAGPIPTGNYDIIFNTEALHSLLMCFVGQFSGKSIKDGVSLFKDSIGQSIAHPEFSLRDLPHFENGIHCALTDAEGFLKKDLTLIEKGELKTFYHNSQTAHYLGTPNTGHATRSAKGHLGTGLTQLYIDAGSTQTQDLFTGKTLHLFALDGLHAGVKPTSGDFSLSASGQLYENGQPTQGVKGITISGNFFKMMKEIEAISNSVHPSSDHSFFAPDIRFSSIKVAGN